MSIDLNNLSQDDLTALRKALGITAPEPTTGRSPWFGNRQLHDLRLLPTATDPRPTFFMSAEAPRDVDTSKTYEFDHGKLLWHQKTGEEITVYSLKDQTDKLAQGYGLRPPAEIVVDPMDAIRDALAGLSEADRALILESQKRARIGKLEERLADLPMADVEALVSASEPKRRQKTA